MTGTDLCVNKCNQSRSYLNHLVYSHQASLLLVDLLPIFPQLLQQSDSDECQRQLS